MGAITDNRTPGIFGYGAEADHGYQIPNYGISEELPADTDLAEEESPVLVKWDSGVLTKCTAATDIPVAVFQPGSTFTKNDTLMGVFVFLSNTLKLVASAAITEGDLIVVAANGKVQSLPETAGTYYQIGQAIESGAASDEIKIVTQPPVKVVVSS
jgi:hypothetical protein